MVSLLEYEKDEEISMLEQRGSFGWETYVVGGLCCRCSFHLLAFWVLETSAIVLR